MNKTEYVKECLLKHPCLISKLLKDPTYNPAITKGILYKMIPFRSSIEIECKKSLSRNLNKENRDLIRRYDIYNYSDDKNSNQSNYYSEHRISIINYSQASGLYKVLFDMKKYCELNPGSGIHIHIDANKIANHHFLDANSKNFVKVKEFLESKLDSLEEIFGKYEGEYNRKEVEFESKGSWINVRYSRLHSIEFRIAPMTFEYETIIKWIVECNKIVKDLHNVLKVSYK